MLVHQNGGFHRRGKIWWLFVDIFVMVHCLQDVIRDSKPWCCLIIKVCYGFPFTLSLKRSLVYVIFELIFICINHHYHPIHYFGIFNLMVEPQWSIKTGRSCTNIIFASSNFLWFNDNLTAIIWEYLFS